MRRMLAAVMMVAVATVVAAPAEAESVRAPVIQDTFLQSSHPDTNYDEYNTELMVGGHDNVDRWIMLEFDNSDIDTSGQTINGVTLNVFHKYTSKHTPWSVVAVHDINDDTWTEEGATWNNSWENVGDQVGTDTVTFEYGSGQFQNGDLVTWHLPVSAWSDTGRLDFALVHQEDSGQYVQLFDHDHYSAYGSDHPAYLEVTYGEAAVPAPASLVLMPLAIGAVAFVRRRRRLA